MIETREVVNLDILFDQSEINIELKILATVIALTSCAVKLCARRGPIPHSHEALHQIYNTATIIIYR